jgi:hypothetical protein
MALHYQINILFYVYMRLRSVMWDLSKISSVSLVNPFSHDFQEPASSPYISSIASGKNSVHTVT